MRFGQVGNGIFNFIVFLLFYGKFKCIDIKYVFVPVLWRFFAEFLFDFLVYLFLLIVFFYRNNHISCSWVSKNPNRQTFFIIWSDFTRLLLLLNCLMNFLFYFFLILTAVIFQSLLFIIFFHFLPDLAGLWDLIEANSNFFAIRCAYYGYFFSFILVFLSAK